MAAFADLQRQLPAWEAAFQANRDDSHALVVVPSMTFDRELLERVAGVDHYEERLLAMLLYLGQPRTRLVFCTSTAVSRTVVDYYLHLIRKVPSSHSRPRLTMVSCDDASPRSLTEKLLDRPERLQEIRDALVGAGTAVMVVQNTTDLERTLAVRLGIPLFGNPPDLDDLGSKSGSREVFRAAGIELPDGVERLRSMGEAVRALAELKGRHPDLSKAAVKLEQGFSGEGNATFAFTGIDGTTDQARIRQIRGALPRNLRFVAAGETLDDFAMKFADMGGIVEEYIEGADKTSPSAQCRVDPAGEVVRLSTHDQVLGGFGGQVFEGSTFPAVTDYRLQIQEAAYAVGLVLRDRGALGRFAVDFVAVPEGDGTTFRIPAIEINLRRGGTTHPMLTLELLTNGRYDAATGDFYSNSGRVKTYFSTDNRKAEQYRGLNADDLIHLAVLNHVNYDPVTETGAVFHMMGSLSRYGKFGVTCIADTLEEAHAVDRQVTRMLDEATARRDRSAAWPPPVKQG